MVYPRHREEVLEIVPALELFTLHGEKPAHSWLILGLEGSTGGTQAL